MSKGSNYRPVDQKMWQDGYDRVFRGKMEMKKEKKARRPRVTARTEVTGWYGLSSALLGCVNGINNNLSRHEDLRPDISTLTVKVEDAHLVIDVKCDRIEPQGTLEEDDE